MLISSFTLAQHFYPGRRPPGKNRRRPLLFRLLKKLRRFFSEN